MLFGKFELNPEGRPILARLKLYSTLNGYHRKTGIQVKVLVTHRILSDVEI